MIPIYRLMLIFKGLIGRKPLALCDVSDVDGIVCAALFRMKNPEGVIVLAAPSDVNRSILLKRVKWDFVADLPCPGKAKLRADHHATNTPCADIEFYDPSAPASASLAIEALNLRGFDRAEKLVKLAIETDTAKIESAEAIALNDAVKGASYYGKIKLAEMLAEEDIDRVLSRREVKNWIRNYAEVRKATEELASKLPVREVFIAVFRENLNLSYRYLCILLERRGAKMTALLVPKGFFSVRAYLGSASSRYDVSRLARKLGGGGHAYAAGALIRGVSRKRVIRMVLEEISAFTGLKELEVEVIDRNSFRTIRWSR